MKTQTISAKDVDPGDFLYFAGKDRFSKQFCWHRVISVTVIDSTTIVIKTTAFDTWKHPSEAVSVRSI